LVLTNSVKKVWYLTESFIGQTQFFGLLFYRILDSGGPLSCKSQICCLRKENDWGKNGGERTRKCTHWVVFYLFYHQRIKV